MKKKNGKNEPSRKTGQPHQVRIIGGQWKRTPLSVADTVGLRPTPDRVRETVFNWLNHLLGGEWRSVHCLDLFAGTGVLGFETASRGAASVTMVESAQQPYLELQAAKARLNASQVNLMRGDAERVAVSFAQQQEKFNLIFLDPPYRLDLLEKILLACVPLISPEGYLYAESDMPLIGNDHVDAHPWLEPWEIVRADRAGNVFYHLLRLKGDDLKA